MTAVGDAAEEDSIGWWTIAQRGGSTEHDPPAGHHDLIAGVHADQHGIRPGGNGSVNVGAQVVGPISTDSRQQRHIAQPETHGSVTLATDVQQSIGGLKHIGLRGVDPHQLPLPDHSEHDVGQMPGRAADLLVLNLAFGDCEAGVRCE